MIPIIIDVGSGFIKAGVQTDPGPTAIFPTFVGRPRRRYVQQFSGNPAFVGDDAIRLRHQLAFTHPVDHGHIEDWMDLEAIWSYTFEQGLGISPEGRPVLLTEPPLASSSHREHLVEAMVEGFDVAEVNLSIQGVVALYATGRTTGLVVEVGEGVTQVVPVHEGFTDKSAIRRSDFGGQELTMYLQKLLCDNGYTLTTRDDFEHVRLMKETLCYVALDPIEEDAKTDLIVQYDLPDGMQLRDGSTSVMLGSERFYCPEALFEPRILQRDNPPLTELIWQAVQSSPIETRKQCLGSVILSGGSSLFPGLRERLEKELKRVSPPQARSVVHVMAHEDRLFGVWLGAKLFCEPSMRPMQDMLWISKEEWYEEGPSVVARKTPFRLG